ncbi:MULTISPECIES: RagB/SusD family nutrient uptake outer membrane protein [Sphingobacterium]|uniref:RagB/SusD family nutrient uptake outer membrane protein n=1 Tax=Sphingobacterium TaxID=28453 RepID=UPI00257DB012|nr:MULTISPECIES: RagB/SusD family nutrient uptake outer membrane protein [Sphingobacterium]
MMNKVLTYLLIGFLSVSCKDYLDYKPNIKMAIPTTLEDAELLLNNYSDMNMGYPNQGEISSDDYFLNYDNWLSISEIDHRNLYCWNNETLINTMPWQTTYKVVYIANQVIELLNKLDPTVNAAKWKQVHGMAHFYRAFAFQQLLSTYTVAFKKETAAMELGIPIRVTPNMDESAPRSSLEASYEQVISDFKVSAYNLPHVAAGKSMPGKAAAYAALARVYLDMQDYGQAQNYADSALSENDFVLDYNDVDPNTDLPFSRFGKEVLFPATASFSEAFGEYYCFTDTLLYASYQSDDLRKVLFYKTSPTDPDYMTFKGSYDNSFGSPFVGLTTTEIYLIRAECAARNNQLNIANATMNSLLEKRWEKNSYIPIDETDPDRLLALILKERRKELVFRGLRWPDLKRLNMDPTYEKMLIRNLNGTVYQLQPNSLSYGILLPLSAINVGGLVQNKR